MRNKKHTGNNTYTELQTGFDLQVKKRSDRLINYFLTAYFLVGLVFAMFYDTWLIAIGVGSLSLVAYYSAKKVLPGSNLYQYVLSVVFGIFMAQYIYQMHGMFEMHFFAFIGSAILITYQNWKLQVPMMLVVVVHHIIFGYLQNSGAENIYFTQLDSFELRTFILHFLLAAVIFFVCGLWSYQLKKYNEIQVKQSIEMGKLQNEAALAATAQKRAEEQEKSQQELSESNQRFSYATKATSDAIWDRHHSDESVYWGDGFQTLFGYEINKETSQIGFWESKIHPEDTQRVIRIIQQAKEDPSVASWTSEYRFLKANGNYAFVKEKAVILRDERGKPARTIGALQDVTEIRQNEIVLKELNENLAKEKYFLDCLMDNMPDSIYFKDRESRFIRVSKYMAQKFGSSMDDLIGKSDLDIHDDQHAREAYEDEQQIQQTGVPKIDYIEKTVLKDGSDRWVSTTKMPLLNARGETVGTFGMSRDVTKIKRLEQDRHNAMLDKAVAQGKFEMASDVLHDIGNAVIGFGSYLTRVRRLQDQDKLENLQQLSLFFKQHKDSIAMAIGEEKAAAVIKMVCGIALTQRNNNEEIGRSITEQLNIITHIQEILNIQRQYISGHESQERKPVNLRNIINDCLAMIFPSIDKLAIGVSLNIDKELPIIKGDRTKLMQALLNILKNSIDAMDVHASAKTISINAATQNGCLIVEVGDNGKGFDQTTAASLFKRGFSTKSSGTGLGLYNCRSIVESHEGVISVTSEGPGLGSRTTISFKI